MNNDFKFEDLHFLSETNVNNRFSSDDYEALALNDLNTVVISDANDSSLDIVCTYAKLFEILESEDTHNII